MQWIKKTLSSLFSNNQMTKSDVLFILLVGAGVAMWIASIDR